MQQIIWTVIWTSPISAALLMTLVWLFRNWIKVRLTGSIKQEYANALELHKAKLRRDVETELATLNAELKAKIDTQLETHKAELKARVDSDIEFLKARVQKKSHISKSQFDLELANFQRILEAISALVDDTARILCLYDRVETDTGKGEKKVYADKADAACFACGKYCSKCPSICTPSRPNTLY